MSVEQHLQRWVSAGLVTAEQAERIRAFESTEHRPTLLYAIAGLGGLAIAVGLVSIVAANWDDIPGRAKIGLDLALVVLLGVGVAWWERHGPGWARETAIVTMHGLVLASIALIGQVYQLGGEAKDALLVWSLLTALLMSRACSGFAGAIWIIGLQVTWAVWAVWLADLSEAELALGTIYWAPLMCLALGRWPLVQRRRPALAAALEAIGWTELVLCATAGGFAFYSDTAREPWHHAFLAVALSIVLTIAIATLLCKSLPQRVLLFACLVFAHVPLFISPGELELAAAACFVALWLLIAWNGHDARDARLLNLATAMIGLRILSIYFEVFGTLLDTGLGLVSGGLLTIVLVLLWTRKRKQFERELGTGAGS